MWMLTITVNCFIGFAQSLEGGSNTLTEYYFPKWSYVKKGEFKNMHSNWQYKTEAFYTQLQ